jgi:hypothetical protein
LSVGVRVPWLRRKAREHLAIRDDGIKASISVEVRGEDSGRILPKVSSTVEPDVDHDPKGNLNPLIRVFCDSDFCRV